MDVSAKKLSLHKKFAANTLPEQATGKAFALSLK